MADRHYYLGPWMLDESDPSLPTWRAPEGTVGLLDLRRGDMSGYGFFALNDDRDLGGDYESFGNGIDRIEECAVAPERRSIWSSMLGIGAVAGPTLLQMVLDTFDLYGDPESALICPPRTPTHLGQLNLHLGGHSLIHTERWPGTEHRSWTRVQALLQRNYRSIRTQAKADESVIRSLRQGQRPSEPGYQRGMFDRIERDRQRGGGRNFNEQRDALAQHIGETHQRFMTCMMRKYRCLETDVRPADLPIERPLPPETEYTESFNQADSSTLGPDLTWGELAGTDMETLSNQAHAVAADVETWVRAEHDLSSDDCETEFDFYISGAGGSGRRSSAAARFSASALTGYVHRTRDTDESYIYRYTSGAGTALTTNSGPTWSAGDRVGMRSDGSDQTSLQNGGVLDTVTDSTHTGFLRGGFMVRRATAGTCTGDDYAMRDLASPPTGIVRQMLQLHG